MTNTALRLLKIKNKLIAEHKECIATAQQLYLDGMDDLNREFKEIVEYSHNRLKEKMLEINQGDYWEQVALDLRTEKIEDDALMEMCDEEELDEMCREYEGIEMMKGRSIW